VLRQTTVLRRQKILSELKRHGRVQVDALSKQLETSEVTIRKDLTALEQQGVLIRRHGGAIPHESPALSVKAPAKPHDATSDDSEEGLNVSNRKLQIGMSAASLVKDQSRILIDYGTTTTAMIPCLNRVQGLVVMTNSMRTAQAVLALQPSPTLLMTGGTWDAQTQSLQGQIAEKVLTSYDFDQLFLGCDGIDPIRGTTTFSELTGLSRVMADSAKEVIVLATADKTGRRIPNLELPWQSVDKLITDAGMPDNIRQQIEQQGVEVIITHPGGEK